MANPEEHVREVKALFNKGVALGESGDWKGEIATYDELIARFGDDNSERAG